MQSKYLMFLGAGLLSVSSLATAEDIGNGFDVSGNVALTTDYRYRGVSQTDNDFALQGGLDLAHESGLYTGVWASNVDNFNPSPSGDNGSQAEIDIYAGYGQSLTEELALDFNVLYYYYPGASTAGTNEEIDFVEFTPSVSYSTDQFSGSFGISYSPEFFNQAGDGFYYNAGADVPLGSDVTMSLHVGYQTVEEEAQYFDDYLDWSVGFGISLFALDWSVAYVDTDLSTSQCGGSDICDSTVVFTLGKSL